jgi:hypothetical protein
MMTPKPSISLVPHLILLTPQGSGLYSYHHQKESAMSPHRQRLLDQIENLARAIVSCAAPIDAEHAHRVLRNLHVYRDCINMRAMRRVAAELHAEYADYSTR